MPDTICLISEIKYPDLVCYFPISVELLCIHSKIFISNFAQVIEFRCYDEARNSQ